MDHVMAEAVGPKDEEVVERPDDRLESWKEIAAYLKRGVRTAQRWEQAEALPVYRHRHDKRGTVYAFRHEIDAWRENRRERLSRRAAGAQGSAAAWSGARVAAALRRLLPRYRIARLAARLAALILFGLAVVAAWVKI
jgi:hypothetical protein